MDRKQQFEGVYPREASILISFNWNGERHRPRLNLRPTPANLKAAARIRDEILAAISIGKFEDQDYAKYFPDSTYVKQNHISAGELFEDVVETWLTVVGQDLAKTTQKEYRNVLNRHFLPDFGRRKMGSITFEELALSLASKNIQSGKTFNNIMTPLRGVFAYALKTRKIEFDVTLDIPVKKHQKAEPDPLEIELIDPVLDHILNHYGEQWYNYFEIAFFSGFRPSEEIALLWPKVDFRMKKVRVDAARVRAVDKDSKSHRSRDVDLQTRALAAFKRQKKFTFLAAGHVFQNPATGEQLYDTGTAVQDVWRPTLRALGIRDRDAKQTRHTFATMCLHAGMNPAYVAKQMGHTDTRMFFEVYSKWIDGQANHREISKLDALFAKAGWL